MTIYRMSFTTGGFYRNESHVAIDLYNQFTDWQKVRDTVFERNLFQLKTLSGQKRTWSEVYGRLSELSDEQLRFFANSSFQQRNYILWLAICRHYPFVGEFARDVITSLYCIKKPQLSRADYRIFLEAKLLERPQLQKLKESTLKRLQSSLFLFIREAGITDTSYRICPVFLSRSLYQSIKNVKEEELLFFPLAGISEEN